MLGLSVFFNHERHELHERKKDVWFSFCQEIEGVEGFARCKGKLLDAQ